MQSKTFSAEGSPSHNQRLGLLLAAAEPARGRDRLAFGVEVGLARHRLGVPEDVSRASDGEYQSAPDKH